MYIYVYIKNDIYIYIYAHVYLITMRNTHASMFFRKHPVSFTFGMSPTLPRVTGDLLELSNARCMSHDVGHTDPTLLGGWAWDARSRVRKKRETMGKP